MFIFFYLKELKIPKSLFFKRFDADSNRTWSDSVVFDSSDCYVKVEGSRCDIPHKNHHVQLSEVCVKMMPSFFGNFSRKKEPPILGNLGPHPYHRRCFPSYVSLHAVTSEGTFRSFPKAIILLATLGFFAALLLLPELVASGLLAYSFGLRHAVDVDHIAPRQKGPFFDRNLWETSVASVLE